MPKKSHVFTMEHVLKFLKDVPDNIFLLMKTVMIFGLHVACRKSEMCNLLTTDIQDNGCIAIVTLRDTKTKKRRLFTITEECNSYYYYKRYADIRPTTVQNNRFFLCYKGGKCTVQPVGINSFGTFPRKIAQFLKLENDHLYTGHSFRRTSATFLADSGVGIDVLKRHEGWKSSSTAEGYIEENVQHKITVSKSIFKSPLHETSIEEIPCQERVSKEIDLQNITDGTKVTFHDTSDNKPLEETIRSEKNTHLHDTVSDSTMIATQVVLQRNAIEKNSDIYKMGSFNFNNVSNCTFNIYNNDK